jgi:hypothetical protein
MHALWTLFACLSDLRVDWLGEEFAEGENPFDEKCNGWFTSGDRPFYG